MRETKLLKADLHIHTAYSMDCDTSLEKIIKRCLELKINCIAVADHGTIEGALAIQKLAPFTVIVAEEALTPYGEIMGMFLKEVVPSGLSVEETIARIRDQGGLVCIPHPFDTVRGSTVDRKTAERIVGQVDVVEIFNSRTPFLRSSNNAASFARKHGIPGSAGSDAHTHEEIGNAYVEMPEFSGKDDFLQALAHGEIHGHRTNPLKHVNSSWAKINLKT